MDSATNNMALRNYKIVLTERPHDLQQGEESKESVDRSEIHKLSESKNQQQPDNEGSSIADMQLKRRREFETKFNLHVKRSKRGEDITAAAEESLQNEVKAPMVQIPIYPSMVLKSGESDIIDSFLKLQSIKKERENELNTTSSLIKKEPILEDFASLLPYQMSISDVDFGASRKLDIQPEPVDRLDTSNTLNAKESFHQTSPSSFLQQALDRAYANQSGDGFEIGPNGTRLSIEDLAKIRWTGVSAATRSLLALLFDRQTLGTSSLSGKLSPAFPDRAAKDQLDPRKIQDVIYFIKSLFNSSEREIRNIITVKCADTAKAFKRSTLSKSKLGKLF